MKKFLFLLSTMSTLTLSTTTSLVTVDQTNNVLNTTNYSSIINLNNQYQENWKWNDVQIDHSTTTPATGTHESEATIRDFYAANVSWENIFMKSEHLIASGYFALHPYKGAKFFDELTLKLDADNSKLNYQTWIGEADNDQWEGWGHQTSKIKITVTAKYIEETKLTALFIQSYVYARTAGSVHECSTTSEINSISFVA